MELAGERELRESFLLLLRCGNSEHIYIVRGRRLQQQEA
jgi:hypothetical protein